MLMFTLSFGLMAIALSVSGICCSSLPKKIYYYHSAGEIYVICGEFIAFTSDGSGEPIWPCSHPSFSGGGIHEGQLLQPHISTIINTLVYAVSVIITNYYYHRQHGSADLL